MYGEDPEFRSITSRTPSCQALKGAVSDLYRLDDFNLEKIGEGFFSEVFKVTHKSAGKVMVLKMNKVMANRPNMLKEVQLMNKLKHPNILRFKGACVHEGVLNALTEYINGGNLEQLIQQKEEELPWSVRMGIALDMAKGVAYLHSRGIFHRDLTSKNVLIKRTTREITAIIGDFGLATNIPNKSDYRLPQVGSPYWMSPECLNGQYYDHQADIFSFGIILCELIARCDADPDILPRTQNFGVDYIAFSDLCPQCPPHFLKLAFSCVRICPSSRPTVTSLCHDLVPMLDTQRQAEAVDQLAADTSPARPARLRKGAHKRSRSEEEVCVKTTPSEKARFHTRVSSPVTVRGVCHEMSLRDPQYQPSPTPLNPFATLPRMREGKKIIGSTTELFSSCFELPSPARVSTPTGSPPHIYRQSSHKSLPSSPPPSRRASISEGCSPPLSLESKQGLNCASLTKFEEHLFMGRVQLLKQLYSGGRWVSQDDSALTPPGHAHRWPGLVAGFPLRRPGSCESGFYSVSTDDWRMEGGMSSRSIASSLLTVSDLEEDLRAASAFLSNKRTSSVLTDSLENLGDVVEAEASRGQERGYEKDIQAIVEYFERNCRVMDRRANRGRTGHRSGQFLPWNGGQSNDELLPRSQKIDSLIKRVVEKETRCRRLRKTPQRLQVCEGIVRSKLPLFDATKRPGRMSRMPYDEQGFVKARLAIFDKPTPQPSRKLVTDFLSRHQFEPKTGQLRLVEPETKIEKRN